MPKKTATKPRQRRLDKKQQKRKTKNEVSSYTPLPGSFQLVRRSAAIISKNWQLFGGILLVYAVLNVFFASSISSVSNAISYLRSSIDADHSLGGAISGFSGLFNGSGAAGSAANSAAVILLVLLESLVLIWALRHILAGKKVSIKQAYYSAGGPLVPFLLIVFVLILQLLPLTAGSLVFSAVVAVSSSGLAQSLAGAVYIALAAWTIYMISASIFSVYIVTLPGTQPLEALRSSTRLVRFRRWPVIRKILFLPIFIVLAMAIITVPLIIAAPWLAAPLFYVFGIVSLLFAHTYLYSLYRSLLA